MSEDRAQHTKAFIDGFGMAVAELVRQYDRPTIAAGLIAGHGFELSDFDNCDPYDQAVIAELFRAEPQLRRMEKMRAAASLLAATVVRERQP